MIDTVKSFLGEQGLIQTGSSACNVVIGRSFVFEVFQGQRIYITVKASRTADLRREFNSQRVSHAALPEYVPAPLAFGEAKGLSLLASEGVPHVGLTPAMMRNAGDRLSYDIREYFRRSTTAFADEQSGYGHADDLETAIDGLNDRQLAISLRGYLRRVEIGQIETLPRIRQHGDLGTGNLGLTSKGIVVLDWEDFGRVQLPGFDIAILLASCLDYDVPLLKRWFERGEPRRLDRIMTSITDHLGFSRSEFWSFLPIYLTHFLYLKKTFAYKPSIRELVRRVITELCNLPQVGSSPR